MVGAEVAYEPDSLDHFPGHYRIGAGQVHQQIAEEGAATMVEVRSRPLRQVVDWPKRTRKIAVEQGSGLGSIR